MRSKMSLTKEFRMAIALLEIPVSGCTCFNTTPWRMSVDVHEAQQSEIRRTLVDVGAPGLLADLLALLLLPVSSCSGRGGLGGCRFLRLALGLDRGLLCSGCRSLGGSGHGLENEFRPRIHIVAEPLERTLGAICDSAMQSCQWNSRYIRMTPKVLTV